MTRWALATTTDGEPAAKLNAMTSRCLIVDDSTRFLQVARRVLEGDDVTVVGVATSIAEALDLAGRRQPGRGVRRQGRAVRPRDPGPSLDHLVNPGVEPRVEQAQVRAAGRQDG